jgi:hypothetical protein
MDLQVLGQHPDSLGQDGDLHLGRPGITIVNLVVSYEFFFFLFGQSHLSVPPILCAKTIPDSGAKSTLPHPGP